MGIKVKYLDFFFKSIHLAGIRPPYAGVVMCELGNQIMKYKGDEGLFTYVKDKLQRPAVPMTGKEFFSELGFKHTSIDINGKDGAMKLDLREPIPKELWEAFQVVTNFGTTEHIDKQTPVFSNIYELLVKGGVVMHIVPAKDGKLKNHGQYQYVTDFFNFQKERYGYTYIMPPLERPTIPGCISVSMRKS